MYQPLMLLGNIPDPWSKDFRPLILSSDDGPIFDNSLVTNVTAQFGGTAHLPCKVHNIKYADNPVSWIRQRDWHILSSGNIGTFTKDQRFQLLHVPNSHEWTLMIKYLNTRRRDLCLSGFNVYWSKVALLQFTCNCSYCL